MAEFYIKTNRIFSNLRKWSWTFLVLVAGLGLYYPRLGLLILPVMLILMFSGLFKGKYWCGKICPHGSLFDQYLLPLSRNKKIPSFARSKITVIIAFAFFMFMLGRRVIRVASLWGAISFWDRLGYIFVMNYLMVTLVGTALALIFSSRTWCNFCPMGTMQVLFYRLGKFLKINKSTDRKISVVAEEMCHKCGKCARVCPMQLLPYQEFSVNNQLENESCIRCSTCVVNCPANILSLSTEGEALSVIENLDLTGYDKRRRISATIEKINDLQPDVRELILRLPENDYLDFIEGQFVLLKISDNPEMFRAYSISSEAKDKNRIRVTIKKDPIGLGSEIVFSRFLEGDALEIEGPLGRELIVDQESEKILLIAGGIGITPFIPIVDSLLSQTEQVKKVTLVHGANLAADLLYKDYFLSKKDSRFNYLPVVARDSSWLGEKGLVTDVIEKLDLEGYKVYMCGPKPMIEPVLNALKKASVPEDSVYFESA